MALPLTHNDPDLDPTPALPTMTDWLAFWSPASLWRSLAVDVQRRRLQRHAATALRRGECGALARLIVAGDWTTMDKLVDALEARP